METYFLTVLKIKSLEGASSKTGSILRFWGITSSPPLSELLVAAARFVIQDSGNFLLGIIETKTKTKIWTLELPFIWKEIRWRKGATLNVGGFSCLQRNKRQHVWFLEWSEGLLVMMMFLHGLRGLSCARHTSMFSLSLDSFWHYLESLAVR